MATVRMTFQIQGSKCKHNVVARGNRYSPDTVSVVRVVTRVTRTFDDTMITAGNFSTTNCKIIT